MSTRSATLALALLLAASPALRLAAKEAAVVEDFEDNDFAGRLLGSARLESQAAGGRTLLLSLTQAGDSQLGTAWFEEPFDLRAGKVEVELDFWIRSGSSVHPADGMSVIFQLGDDLNAVGHGGGNLGTCDFPVPYFSVAFDVWHNSEAFAGVEPPATPCSAAGSPRTCHVEVNQDSCPLEDPPLQTSASFGAVAPDFVAVGNTLEPLHCRIVMEDGFLSVFLRFQDPASGAEEERQMIGVALRPLPDAAQAILGFAASTGGANAFQEVDNVSIRAASMTPPATITGVQPQEVSYLGKTPLRITGSGFPAGAIVQLVLPVGASQSLEDLVTTPGSIEGRIPALINPAPGATAGVRILGLGGAVLAAMDDAVRFVGPLDITAVEPSSIPAGAVAEVMLRGAGFTPETVVELATGGLPDIARYVDARTLSLQVGALPAGSYDLGVRDMDAGGRAIRASSTVPLTVLPTQLPVIHFVAPRFVPTDGDVTIDVHGDHFFPGLELVFDGAAAVAVPFELISERLLRALAPPQPPGDVDVVVRWGGAAAGQSARLADAVTYFDPSLGAPEEVETTVVDGEVQMQWVNPEPYGEIRVYRGEELIASLPGTARSFTDPTRLSGSALYRLEGVTSGRGSAVASFVAARWFCGIGVAPPSGERGDTDFRVLGGHQAYSAGDGGGAGMLSTQSLLSQHPVVEASEGLSRARFPDLLTMPERIIAPTELVTGFNLFQEARKLRVLIHGAKLESGPGLSLRVLIESVTPNIERVIELVAPDPITDPRHAWIDFTYNTENPDPARRTLSLPAGPSTTTDLPLPPADYKVTVYAVGGRPGTAHHAISSDRSTDQILVPGVGCPPYPLVQVHDTTGLNSKPEIHSVAQHGQTQVQGNNAQVAVLRAEASDPDGDPIVRYVWRVETGQQLTVKVSSTNTQCFTFADYGVYDVEVEAWDNRCGIEVRRFLVQIEPPAVCAPGNGTNYTFPSPRPDSLHFVPYLPGGMDAFHGQVPQMFRVFVTFPGACSPGGGPFTEAEVQLGLGNCINDGCSPVEYHDTQAPAVADAAVVGDPQNARQFWQATFGDMGRLPNLQNVRLLARSRLQGSNTWGPWQRAQAYTTSGSPQPIPLSARLRLKRKPAYLDDTSFFTTGSYEPRSRTYHFTLDLAPPGQAAIAFPDIPPRLFDPLPAGDRIQLDAIANRWRDVRQTARLSMSRGVWSLDSISAGADGVVMNGSIAAGGEMLAARAQGGGAGITLPRCEAGFDPASLSLAFCCDGRIFERSWSWGIYTGPIFDAPIGIVNVSAFASVALGIDLAIDAHARLNLDAQNPLSSTGDLWIDPRAHASVPVDLTAVLFTGVFDIIFDADFSADLDLQVPVHIGVDASGPRFDFALGTQLLVGMEWTGCALCPGLCPLPVFCVSGERELFNDALITVGNPASPVFQPTPCPLNLAGGGAGATPVPINPPERQLAVASSPSGLVQVGAGVFDARRGNLMQFYRVRGQDWQIPITGGFPHNPPGGGLAGFKESPQIVFLNEDTILVAWTQSLAHLDPQVSQLDPENGLTLAEFNAIYRRTEIALQAGRLTVNQGTGDVQIAWQLPVLLHGDSQNPIADDRADGRVALAKIPGQEQVWAAWTRYDDGDIAVLSDANDPQSPPVYNLRKTSTYARRIGLGPGPVPVLIGNDFAVSGPDNEIDVEPDVSVAPGGSAIIVWVKDPLHDNLHDANAGRELVHSMWNGSSWSPPAPIIADVSALPAIWEPSVALRDAQTGMVAFTALPENALENDAGLGNTRLVHTVRLQMGAWGDPQLIFKDCATPIFGRHNVLGYPGEGFEEASVFPYDFFLVFDRIDPFTNDRTIAMTTFQDGWGPVQTLSPGDGRVHRGVAVSAPADGTFHLAHQSYSLANARGVGGGAGAPEELADVAALSFAGVADPAIVSCKISDAFAAPGSGVTVAVGVANHGFAAIAPATGQGALSLRAYYVDDDGVRRQAAEAAVPELDPGAEAVIAMQLVIPREPVQLRVEVDGVTGERNALDNVRTCPLGALPPLDLTCEHVVVPEEAEEEAEEEAALLRWTPAGLYDRVLIYRDGALLTEIPGSETSCVDLGPADRDGPRLAGEHEYAVRGGVGGSISVRALCRFERGGTAGLSLPYDCNGDLRLDISDAVCHLGYMFLGTTAPACLESMDLNGDGRTDISDPVGLLGYLFLGIWPPAFRPECRAFPSCAGDALCR